MRRLCSSLYSFSSVSGVGSRRCQNASIKLSRSSSFESCLKAALSSSVMIHTTSSFNHFLYVLLSSIFRDFLCCFFCFSLGERLRGSISSVGCACEPVTVAPDFESSAAAGLSLWAIAVPAKPVAITRNAKEKKNRDPTRDMRGTPTTTNFRLAYSGPYSRLSVARKQG